MPYTYSQINAYPSVSLHDCRANRLNLNSERLEFTFDIGFTLTPQTELNAQNRCVDTGRAALVFTGAEAEFYLYREHRLFRRTVVTTRKTLSMNQLADKLNSGEWELEFIHEYFGYNSAFYACCIWQKCKPWSIECQLDIYCKQIEYFWNDTL